MRDTLAELPDNIELLKALVRSKDERILEIEKKLAFAEEQHRSLAKRHFGRSSESYSPDDDRQNRLFDEAELYADHAAVPVLAKIQVLGHERQKRGRKPRLAAVERIEIVHDLPDEEKLCPCCGGNRLPIGEERTSEYDLIPARVVEQVHIVKKFGPCRCEDFAASGNATILSAPGP